MSKAFLKLPPRSLSSGTHIPVLGLGTGLLSPSAVEPVILSALDIGYRHFDCAAAYKNEREIGAALRKSRVPREELFVTSKLWNTHHAREDVFSSFEQTLQDLQLDYLDLYLIHWPLSWEKDEAGETLLDENGFPVPKPVNIAETWAALEELVERKRVLAIGVSNFTVTHLVNLLTTSNIHPAVNQVEIHPYLPQPHLASFCRHHNIQVTAFSPLGSSGEPNLLSDPVIKKIGTRQGLTPAQVALSWNITKDHVVIPRTTKVERLEENASGKILGGATMAKLDVLGKKEHRYINPQTYWNVSCFEE